MGLSFAAVAVAGYYAGYVVGKPALAFTRTPFSAARTKPTVPVPKRTPVIQAPQPLANPPEIVNAVYYTGWSAGLNRRINYLIELRRSTGVNAVVIDIKDFSGLLSYRVAAPEAERYKAVRATVRDIDALVERLHREGIYVIGRITCFQDPVLAHARPELAVHQLSKLNRPLTPASLWLDHKGLAWIDPAAKPAWEYIAAIGRDVLSHGFDELNFDYIRFPSDGDMKDMYYPAWDGKTPKHAVVRTFFSYLRKRFPAARISADLFGLATVSDDDLGIGQVIEDAYTQFDFVCPMVYPSHYARHFHGFRNPAEHPYEVVSYSMEQARARLETVKSKHAKLRPWLQDFNLGAKYTPAMIESEIAAVRDSLGENYAGFMMWAPSNVYTREALIEKPKRAQK